MPELPEVEHVKRGIEPFIINTIIKSVTFSSKVIDGKSDGKETIIKGINLDGFRQFTEGYKIYKVERRSKYINIYIEKNQECRVLISHLGMAGGFFIVNHLDEIYAPNYRKHWHVIFHLSNGKLLVYSDIRRFGEIRNVQALNNYASFKNMAPEPFDESALDHYLTYLNQPKVKHKPIKQLILDHKVIAGCGNIYACEALYRAAIHPATEVQSLNQQARQNLFLEVQAVLNEGIEYGGTSISDYRHADGKTGTMQLRLNVYKQQQCKKCGHKIEQQVIATRNSHFCPVCQK